MIKSQEKLWAYNEPIWGENGELLGDEVIVYTEAAILAEYWDYWTGRTATVGKGFLCSEELCIEDWVVVNWAWEYKE